MSEDIAAVLENISGEEAPENAECFTEHSPLDVHEEGFEDNVLAVREGEVIKIGYVMHDESYCMHVGDYWKEFDQGEFREFESPEERDGYIEENEDAGRKALLVEHYEHGAHHFSVAGTHRYRYHDFDCLPSCVFVPREDVQGEYTKTKAEKGAEAAEEWIVEHANLVLGEYSNFANGQVFILVVEEWMRGEEYWEPDEMATESVGGHIGAEHAIACLREMVGAEQAGAEEKAEAKAAGLNPA